MAIELGIASAAPKVLQLRRRTEHVWLNLGHGHRETAGGTNEAESPSSLNQPCHDGQGSMYWLRAPCHAR